MVLSKSGSQTFIAYEAWHKYCKDNNIKDPWHLEREIEKEYTQYGEETIDGITAWTIKQDDPTIEQKQRLAECHKYRDKYMEDREIWVGNYILKNFGYDALIIFAQAHNNPKTAFQKWFTQIEPCTGIEGQCNIFCHKFLNCLYKGAVQ